MSDPIELPTARSLRLDNQNLTIKVKRLTAEKEELWDELQLLRKAGRKSPKELKEKIKELEDKVEYLEGEVDASKEDADIDRSDVEHVFKEIKGMIREVTIVLQGGSNADSHKFGFAQLRSELLSWKDYLENFLRRD